MLTKANGTVLILCLIFGIQLLAGCREKSRDEYPPTPEQAALLEDLSEVEIGEKAQDIPQLSEEELATFEGELKSKIHTLKKTRGYEVLHQIDGPNMLNYLTGYYPRGGSDPCIYFDPQSKRITVLANKYQESFSAKEVDDALAAFKERLKLEEYEIDGEVLDTKQYVDYNGQKMVVMTMEDLLGDKDEVKKHFSPKQYNFMYNEMGSWTGFTYLSGFGETGRDYPLMVGLGYAEQGHVRFLTKNKAEKYAFTELEKAFAAYKEYLSSY